MLAWLLVIPPAATAFAQEVGYATLEPESGATAVGSAVFSYTNAAGTLVSEAGVAAAPPLSRGRLFVDQAGSKTGLALANPGSGSADIMLTLRSDDGAVAAQSPLVLTAGAHTAVFVDQIFPGASPGFRGSLTIETSAPVAALTLRESPNAFGEPVYTTLPVIDLDAPPGAAPVTFPHLAAGDGYTTELILLNPGDESITGIVRFFGGDGQPLVLDHAGGASSEVPYVLPPDGVVLVVLASDSLRTGYAVAEPLAGPAPSGSLVFRFSNGVNTVTEAGVGIVPPTTRARLSVDNVETQSGLAIANPGPVTADVTLELLDRFGIVQEEVALQLPPGTHVARMLHEIFPAIVRGYSGLLGVESTVPVVPIALQLTINTRNELVLTTLPLAALDGIPASNLLVIPQLALGGGFDTRLILLNPDGSAPAAGEVTFRRSDGSPFDVAIAEALASSYNYALGPGAGQRVVPGSDATVAEVTFRDPANNTVATEIVVNAGGELRPRVLLVDSDGRAREEYLLGFVSSNQSVAVVEPDGRVRGVSAGFATLVVTAGGMVAVTTMTVVDAEVSSDGFEAAGVAEDLAGGVYLVSSETHTVVVTHDFGLPSETYAGVANAPGFVDDLREVARFNRPAALAIDQAAGTIFVTEAANHAVRRVGSGEQGEVETLAGTGTAGSADGGGQTARFNEPRGVALDGRGNLWVADSLNHTIRRIDLSTGTVSTVAGVAGEPGLIDGAGPEARFARPTGIALEPESVGEELERQFLGLGPSPVRVIVTDTGNGVLRRVHEDGVVETIGGVETSGIAAGSADSVRAVTSGTVFGSPDGVAVDRGGNIFVAEPDSGRVRVVLPGGRVVSLAQEGTFERPRGVTLTRDGTVVVADRSRATRIRFGPPSIDSVSLETFGPGTPETVVVRGRNFPPEVRVILSGAVVVEIDREDTETLRFRVPPVPSGNATLTVQTRGGLAQRPVLVRSIPLFDLPAGAVATVAGGTTFGGEGRLATDTPVFSPYALALDSGGNLYVSDWRTNVVRRIDRATGTLSSVAGSGRLGYSGDGGQALAARLGNPQALAFDPDGNLLIADQLNNRIRRVDRATGVVETVAGNGSSSFSGAGLPATLASFRPTGIATDRVGNVVVADSRNNRIFSISQGGGVTIVAGSGVAGFSGDGGDARSARLRTPTNVALDRDGSIFIFDAGNLRIRRVDRATGLIETVAGTGTRGSSADGTIATNAALDPLTSEFFPGGLAVDSDGNLLIADTFNNRVRRVDRTTGVIETVAGNGSAGFGPDGGPATEARLTPTGVVVDGAGNIYVADATAERVVQVDARTGTLRVVAGNGAEALTEENAQAAAATFIRPVALAFHPAGDLIVADMFGNSIRRVDAVTERIVTLAGPGVLPDEFLFLAIEPGGVVVAADGDVIYSQPYQSVVRRIDAATGDIVVVAGTGQFGFSGDGGAATEARFDEPSGLALDSAGNLYIADIGNQRVRKVDAATGIVTTVAGDGGAGLSGDDGPATGASLNFAAGLGLWFASLAIDSNDDLWIGDTLNNRIRRVDTGTGIITTVAGSGPAGLFTAPGSGDGGPAALARLKAPTGLAFGPDGNLYFVDSSFGIRRIDLATGIITRVAGGDGFGFAGDGGSAEAALFDFIEALAFDAGGNLYLADSGNRRVRAIRGPIP